MRKGLFVLIAAGIWATSAAVSVRSQAADAVVRGAMGVTMNPAWWRFPSVQTTAQAPSAATQYRPMLDRYCVSCHNERLKTGDLALDKLDLAKVPDDAAIWEKVVRKMRNGMMPPQGLARPDQATNDAFVSYLETTLDRAADVTPNPGRPVLHRVNRAEYANAIHDLLALDVDTSTLLPPDDSSFGFDNIGEVLGVSPALQERYLSAARKISAIAVGDPTIGTTDETYAVRADFSQTQHVEGLPLGTRGGRLIRHTFPLDGQYQFKVRIWRTNTGTVRGLATAHKIVVTIDGEQIFENMVGGAADPPLDGDNNATLRGDAIDARLVVKVPVKAGPHVVGIAFQEKDEALPPNLLQPFLAVLDQVDGDGIPQLQDLKITGPLNPTGPGDTPSRRRILVCRPARAVEEEACAKTILTTLARRAYRRPATDNDLQVLLNFYRTGRSEGSFDQGIELALRLILASPEFVFRVERDPAAVAAGRSYRVSDLELASRLSFFLWSSIPDDALLEVAAQGKLKSPTVLAQQVKRMLADSHAEALTSNFAGQWLYLRNLKSQFPNREEFPDFDDNLRQAMQRETELLFESVIHEDRSVLDLLNANYTFVNERLARHYGIPNIRGTQFRRVPVTDEARRGLLGQASILTVTSRAERTSPVLRGKWVLENLLGSPPPLPPNNVPPLKEEQARAKPKTMREQMEEHRANPVCATCHKMMDPIGFSLENFDAVGAWRDHDRGAPIDASGQLMDGTKVDGVVTLRQAIVRRPEIFVGTMTEKMLVYALGRGLDYHDMPVVRGIVRDAAKTNYKFSSIVMGIVNSTPFQMRLKAAQEPVATSARVRAN